VQYSVSRVVGSLTLVVSKAVDGAGGLHEAHIDFEPLVVKAAAALKEHREAIEQLPAARAALTDEEEGGG
jgi:hypothetical protein